MRFAAEQRRRNSLVLRVARDEADDAEVTVGPALAVEGMKEEDEAAAAEQQVALFAASAPADEERYRKE